MNISIPAQVAKIGSDLEARGTKLRPSADPSELAELEALIEGPLSLEARTLFSAFDGFEDQMPDELTMISIWPISSIKMHLLNHGKGRNGLIFADYFLAAELFSCDLTKENSAVWWNERGTTVANNLHEFLSKIVRGIVGPDNPRQ